MSTATTEIAWTDRTWNPVRGCSRVSPGCDNCYAMGQAHRFAGPGKPFEGLTTLRKGKVDWSGRVRFVPAALAEPLSWRKPARIFVNSMSDLFHHSMKVDDIAAVFGAMASCSRHTFQILTKRADRMREVMAQLDPQKCREAFDARAGMWGNESVPWPLPWVHLGVSCEDQQRADERIPHLLETPAAVRWISAEPLLGPLNVSRYMPAWFCDDCRAFMLGRGDDGCDPDEGEASPCCSKCGSLRVRHVGLDWVVVGGESGPGARMFELPWGESLVKQCRDAGVPIFVKQLGAKPHATLERIRTWPEARKLWQALPGEGTHQVVLTDRKGGDISEFPSVLRVRQFPEARS